MDASYLNSKLYALRHSAAHLMAQSVLQLFPDAKLTIGPPIENGFYYDIDFGDEKFTEDDLAKVEARMAENARADFPIEREDAGRDSAKDIILRLRQDPYKVELLDDIPDGDTITFYKQGDFIDLCRGPHVESTGEIRHYKLLNIAGAYWRGSEKNKMLTRLYGTAFETKEELDRYLDNLEEAKKRDHRILGKELGLFMFSKSVGQGLPLWLPNGAVLRDVLTEYMKSEQLKRGYEPVVTPHLGQKELWEKSGHWNTYRDKMYPVMDDGDTQFLLKPMNCPFHIEIYASELRSYRDLPVRLAEFGTVYRYEQSGEVTGILRARGFTQDDAHLFVTPDQLLDEFKNVIDLMLVTRRKLGLEDFTIRIGTRDPNSDKYVGEDDNWEKSETAIREACDSMEIEYVVSVGDAAFYGPKADLMIKDALGRTWQMGTVQVDYNLPERFGLEYIGEDGKPHRPIMIHRAPFGSLERMIGLLTEHYAGAFPFWMAPVQIAILPIADRHADYAASIRDQMMSRDGKLRVKIDDRRETLGKKIRENQGQKIPYMLIVGDKDIEAGTVSV
ncbi:MAG: threonine--tRNA ligase, partial [Armatimonadetes bacterium]|nr:threonine--tRNA ligase [Armatimonadota bacterium]